MLRYDPQNVGPPCYTYSMNKSQIIEKVNGPLGFAIVPAYWRHSVIALMVEFPGVYRVEYKGSARVVTLASSNPPKNGMENYRRTV